MPIFVHKNVCLYLYICADVPHTSSVIKNMPICRRRVNQLLICTSTNLSGSFWCCHCFPHWTGCLYIYIYFFNWKLITLQYCIGFAIHWHESATCVHVFPILNPRPTSLPIPPLWVIPVPQPQAPCIMHRTWTGISFHIRYYTHFNAILPNHPTLALSHRVQKTVLYICVSHTGLLLPSF